MVGRRSPSLACPTLREGSAVGRFTRGSGGLIGQRIAARRQRLAEQMLKEDKEPATL